MTEGGIGIGDRAPQFELRDTSDQLHDLGEPGRAEATVVVWTCNHCPYALAWHDRILAVAEEHSESGVRTLLINSNDAERFPADSLEAMRERVDAEGWPVPYLHDADQSVAREFGAKTTPDVFVLDSEHRLVYRGAPDADHQDPSHDAAWLRDALAAVKAGETPERAETEPVGCSIKWKA